MGASVADKPPAVLHPGRRDRGTTGRFWSRASDVGIEQFKLSLRLMFVYGRSNYERIGLVVVMFTFFKNMYA